MKIGIITIHSTNNYGAVLQAYATQVVLSKFGDVYIINYKNSKSSNGLKIVRFELNLSGVSQSLKDMCRLISRITLIKKFKIFLKKHLRLTHLVDNKSITSLQNDFDVLVSGSDQIWNPVCVSSNGRIDPCYFLCFGGEKTRKISYASSVGNYIYDQKMANEVATYLSCYDDISVREKKTREIVKDLVSKEIHVVLDPTLLLSASDYDELLTKKSFKKMPPYIFVYIVPGDSLLNDVVQYNKKKYHLPIIVLDQSLHRRIEEAKKISNAGIEEFLYLIKNAHMVITDSFHGACFSIVYRKRFLVVSSRREEARIPTLLSLLGLSNLVSSSDDIGKSGDFDYAPVVYKLKEHQVASSRFLAFAIAGR